MDDMTNNPILRSRDANGVPVKEWLIPNPHFNTGEYDDDDKWWYHCEDGPALVLYDGRDPNQPQCEAWLQYNQHYRLDGPTVIYYNKNGEVDRYEWRHFDEEYDTFAEWLNDIPLTKEQKVELKLIYG